jgi:LPXTG-site transpeptidase (sortase) family protein
MLKKHRPLRSKLVTIVSILLMLSAAGLLVHYYLDNKQHVVTLQDSYRALADNERPSEQVPPLQKAETYGNNDATPKSLKIVKLGIESRIVPLAIDAHNRLQAPANIYDVGWVSKTAKPTDTDGYMVLDGHVQGYSNEGVFKHLDNLKKGDEILVMQVDGKVIPFVVSSIKRVSYDEPAPKTLLAPTRVGMFELRIVTCAGTYLKDKKLYSQRLIVTANRDDSL